MYWEGGGGKCDCGTTQSCYIPSQWVTDSLFFSILLQCSQIILYSSSLPHVYTVILSYSLSLGVDWLSLPSFFFFKDALKLSTQILTTLNFPLRTSGIQFPGRISSPRFNLVYTRCVGHSVLGFSLVSHHLSVYETFNLSKFDSLSLTTPTPLFIYSPWISFYLI